MTYKKQRNSFRPANSSDNDHSDASQSQSQSQSQSNYIASESEPNSPSAPFSSQLAPAESVSSSSNKTKSGASPSPPSNTKNFSHCHCPSYIPICPLPVFHGDSNECPITHLTRFAKFCRANFSYPSTEMMLRIFPVTLENEAALWYDLNIDPYPSLAWEEIRSLFLQAYNKVELVAHLGSELTMIKQGSDESVRAYFLRLQWILKRWPDHGLDDYVINGVFVDGLREEFKDWIVPQKPKSLNDALRLAFGFEQAKSVGAAAAKEVAVKCGFCGGWHEEKGCEVRERMRELWVNLKSKEEEGNGDVGKELVVRLESVGRSGGGGGGGKSEEEEGEFVVGWKKKRQCQCWKHQCWKKKLERSKSLVP